MVASQRLIALTVGIFLIGVTGYSAHRATPVVTVPECPNLSGKYMIQGEDGQVHISIEQVRCDRATIRRESGYLGTITREQHTFKLDGTVQEDPPWFGGTEPYKTSAKFKESFLRIEAKSNSRITLTVIYSLTLEGDLVEEV